MPLTKSAGKQAFSSNVAAEVNAGKPQKQAVAIAYSVKRKAEGMHKRGKISDKAMERLENKGERKLPEKNDYEG